MSSLEQVEVELSVVLGRALISIHQLLKMGRGAVIALDAHQNDDVWILANNQLVARGEIVVEGERITVNITDMIQPYA